MNIGDYEFRFKHTPRFVHPVSGKEYVLLNVPDFAGKVAKETSGMTECTVIKDGKEVAYVRALTSPYDQFSRPKGTFTAFRKAMECLRLHVELSHNDREAMWSDFFFNCPKSFPGNSTGFTTNDGY